ncbi:MAG: FMN-binding protein [Eudoraea sp.]|nr:FMN-binding protein [Eudoraea sp.]
MGFLLKSILICSSLLAVSFSMGLDRNLEKKIRKEIEKTFQCTDCKLIIVPISKDAHDSLPLDCIDKLYKIENVDELVGYAFVSKARSKTADFDYLVLFNPEIRVIHAKVLIYREDYGGEIGSKRWLKQFYGLGVQDRVHPERNIDAISGATISVRSMTYAMDKLLQSMGILQKKGIL